jgi:hypothetical protein
MSLTTNRIKTTTRTKLIMPGSSAQIGAGAGWTVANDNGLLSMAASQTSGTASIPITGLAVGDTITGVRYRGGKGNTGALTLVVALKSLVSASGAITCANVQTLTGDTTSAAHAVDVDTPLTTALKIADKYSYFILLTGTTAASSTIDITSIEVDVKKTLGQEA